MTKRLEDILKQTEKGFKTLEGVVYASMWEYMSTALDIKEGKVTLSASNIRILQGLEKSDSVLSQLGKFFKSIINGILGYFGESLESLSRFDRSITRTAAPTIEKIKQHSLLNLNGVMTLESVYAEVKQKAIALMSRPGGISLKVLQEEIKKAVVVDGAASKYYGRWTYDLYSQYERVATNEVRKEIGLTWAIYQGGLIKTSRDFCEERNGNVYSEAEIMAWANLEWDGKPTIGYDPLTDQGGYNCRHRYDWISYQLAKRLRPGI